MDDELVKLGIVRHLFGVHAETDHPLRTQLLRKVRAPARHQIEQLALRWEILGEEFANRCDRWLIEVDHLPGRGVEERVVAVVGALEEIRCEGMIAGRRRHAGSLPYKR